MSAIAPTEPIGRARPTMWLVRGGRLAARGAPADVLASAATREAFELEIHVGALPSGLPFAVPA